MAKRCPACGKGASGKFCSNCGASLEKGAPRSCGACSNEIPAGGRYCNMCGTPVGAATPPVGTATNRRALYLGGAVLVLAAIVVLFVSRDRSPEPLGPPVPQVAGPAPLDPSAVDLSQMTPREAADRLFDRVMRSVSAGDSASARSFAPMALAAYDMVDDIDLDGRYHVALLHLVNGDARAAREEAGRILEAVPTHLFGLYTAAQAEEMIGNRDGAAPLYRSFLENYEAELATRRSEYVDHAQVLPAMREEAARAR